MCAEGLQSYPLRVVTFDLDDTLWDTRAAIAVANECFFATLNARSPLALTPPLFTPSSFHTKMRAVYRAEPGTYQHDLTALRRVTLRRCALEDAGLAPSPEVEALVEAGVGAFLEGRNRPPLDEGVAASLRLLKRKYGLVFGAITNGNADVSRIDGLGGLFDFSVSSAEAGAAKPAAEPFVLAMAKGSALVLGGAPAVENAGSSAGRNANGGNSAGAGEAVAAVGKGSHGEASAGAAAMASAAHQAAHPTLLPAACFLHVGDDAECDVYGAKQLGMRTVWIQRPGGNNHGINKSAARAAAFASAGTDADLVLKSVVELPGSAELARWTQDPRRHMAKGWPGALAASSSRL